MTGPSLSVGRGVITEMARLAAYEISGVSRVARGGPGWRAWLAGPPVGVWIREGRVHVRVHVIARPAHGLAEIAAGVHTAVAATVERLLGLQLGTITVVVDGVGG